MEPAAAKEEARALWDHLPAGSAHAPSSAVGTAEFFRAARARRAAHEMPWLTEVIPFEGLRGKDVLEVGCGAGFDAYAISSAGARYVGVDLADRNPARTRAHLAHEGLSPRVLQADAEHLPFHDACFDVVFSNGVLHHVPGVERALAEIRRVLRPGGTFYCLLYHRDSIFHWGQLVLRDLVWRRGILTRSYEDRLSEVEHEGATGRRPLVRVYSRRRARRLLEAAGLAVEQVRVRKLAPEDFPGALFARVAGSVPAAALDAVGRVAGWYVVLTARRASLTLCVERDALRRAPESGEERVAFSTLREWLRTGEWLRRLRRYDDVVVHTARLELQPRPFLTALSLLPLGRTARFEDARGRAEALDVADALRLGTRAGLEVLRRPWVLRRIGRELDALEAAPRPRVFFARALPTLYLRTNLDFDLRAGGSVGHVAGVLNNLDAFTGRPVFVTTDRVATVRPDLETVLIPLPSTFRELPYTRGLNLNLEAEAFVLGVAAGRPWGCLYQRYDLYDYLGLKVARQLGVPLILEFNGSEVWVQEHWGEGHALPHSDLARRIETIALRGADLVVVVSDALREQLVGAPWGLDPARILVNPNGVDAGKFRPDLDGGGVRLRLGLARKVVVGFIGTFGAWHGAEVLAEAWARLLARSPELARSAHLLFIGDGVRLEATRAVVARAGLEASVTFTGLVPQAEGPAHLAACDVLVAPHVPNVDGSRFFGSPTKLFEYMAMGRGIVSTSLEQLGEVLEHDRTAWLVPPGDVDALADGIGRLARDPALRARLGAAAREAAVERHTWRAHTQRIVERLGALCPM